MAGVRPESRKGTKVPKENIVPAITYVYDKDGHEVDEGLATASFNIPEGGHSDTTPAVDLNWSKEHEHVQVSVEFDRDRWIAIADELKANPEVSKKAIYSPGMSRYQINKLIKTLRRARDAAFGSDE